MMADHRYRSWSGRNSLSAQQHFERKCPIFRQPQTIIETANLEEESPLDEQIHAPCSRVPAKQR